MLPLHWMLPIAVAAAIVLLLPSTSLITGAAERLSAWTWLGIGGLLVLAPVPSVVAAMRYGGPYQWLDGGVVSEVLSIVGGAAATLSLVVGAAVVVERARLDSARGLTSSVALLSIGILGVVGTVAIVARQLPPAAISVPLALSAAAVPAALLLRRGRHRLAQVVLWCTFALALVYWVTIFLSIQLAQMFGDMDARAVVAEYGGFGVTLGILAITGLMALTNARPDPR